MFWNLFNILLSLAFGVVGGLLALLAAADLWCLAEVSGSEFQPVARTGGALFVILLWMATLAALGWVGMALALTGVWILAGAVGPVVVAAALNR